MIPTTLSAATNYFVGKFSFTSSDMYWYSQRLDGVRKILDHKWVYGDYIAASTLNRDGTYSMWLSNNLGHRWSKRFTTSYEITKFEVYDMGVVLLFTADNKAYESINSGSDYTLVNSNTPAIKDIAVSGYMYGNSKDVITHNGNSITTSQDRCRSFVKTLDLTDNYTQSELVHPTIAMSGVTVLASAGEDIVHSTSGGDVGSWSTLVTLNSREYVKHLVSTASGYNETFLTISDDRSNNNSSVYHTPDRVSWSNSLILSTAPKEKPVGYSIKSNDGSLVTHHIMRIKITKSTLDKITHDRWKRASHATSGPLYKWWLDSEPVISNDPTLVNTYATTNDGGKTWEIADENKPYAEVPPDTSNLLNDLATTNRQLGGV
jgi:hypothetical protein